MQCILHLVCIHLLTMKHQHQTKQFKPSTALYLQESFSAHQYVLSWQLETHLSYWAFCCFIFTGLVIALWGDLLDLWLFHLLCLIITLLYFVSYSVNSLLGRAKLLGPVLKLLICVCLPVLLILWVVVAIVGSIIGGILYGFLSPIFATFDAVGEGKTNVFFHCFYVCLRYPCSDNLFTCVNFSCSSIFGGRLIYCSACRMVLGALSREASLLSGISMMFVSIPSPHIWKSCNRKSLQMENTMRSGRYAVLAACFKSCCCHWPRESFMPWSCNPQQPR